MRGSGGRAGGGLSRRRPLKGRRRKNERKGQTVSDGGWRTLIDMFLLARVMFLLRTDGQTAPMHTGAIQGNCVKSDVTEKIEPTNLLFSPALRSRPLHVALEKKNSSPFSPFLSLVTLCPPVFVALYLHQFLP